MMDGAFLPVLTSKQMQATKEQGAGEIAREALCQVSPAVKTVLSLALAETMFTKQKCKQLEDILGVVGWLVLNYVGAAEYLVHLL